MGIAGGVLLTVFVFISGSLLTAYLEPYLNLAVKEPGPSAPFASKNIRPRHTDSWLYNAAPFTALMGVMLASVVLPLDKNLIGADIKIGLFYFIVVVDFVVLAIALGGWGGGMPSSVEAAYRIVAQLVAYVVPLGLAIIGPIMMAKSMSTVNIVNSQSSFWYILVQPTGFILYIITGLMQVYRAPFLEPFADDIKGGITSIYGGWRGKIMRLAMSGVFFVIAAMGAVLFLGGWKGPLLPGPVWFYLKTIFMLALMKYAGQKVRLLSSAQMLELSWKILIPAGLLNVLIVGGLILLGVGG